ncbi:voltage-dependent calcium channel subunit alpha-2/delta-3 [Acyrthosiphon pisum]|uniref:VWFA domain-containing protein n=1 Tax=Acyrthosiphon pisum TaxID=7029 RepID=A0A8R2H961_ACYPI|nr:voltage-dependent calcium channel subunit alpha-2/delta-3 [Acyrthosiphon pisum]|eukprot:XP_016664622.1 PREDICTED: voltage-dependent calcium channel subunit alpha-2/delta-3 [Acyrthosiphon pisum]
MNICVSVCTFLVTVLFVIYAIDVQDDKKSSLEELLVENWAETFGKELWYLGQNITKSDEIRLRYKKLNETHVFRTNASQLLQNISTAMNRMIRLKMTAVSCLMDAAERLSEEFEWKFYGENGISNYTYYNAKYSPVEGIDDCNDTDRTTPNISLDLGKIIIQLEFKTMNLTKNDHFYGLSVNTDYSAVYLPTILFEKLEHVQKPLQWSEKMDEVFLQNYRSDPSLSWQYFGSTAGFMRHYPAIRWSAKPSVFDTRLRPWYIQAATCSKDVVILLDISGSMSGMHQSISQLVIKSLLKTFNNDDSINIIFFNTGFTYLVTCFKELLVQATPENLYTFHKAIIEDPRLLPSSTANYSKAFIEAFQLLSNNRNNNRCSEETCNQMIMLVTDDDPNEELFDVVQKHNRIDDNKFTNIPVRIFTYMMGRDITTTPELERLACENRGSFAHVHSKDEVLESVLKYIAVLARPLVLQAEKHPVTWSHTFMDISDPYVTSALKNSMDFDKQMSDLAANLNEQKQFPNQHKMDSKYLILNSESVDEDGNYQEYRPMTAISIPIFNKKRDEYNKTRVKGDLLGVAGTDVPIAEFEKLTLPYKIGVNGYAFVVTNNGYVLFHPKLRPVEDGILKDNHNSIDLTELEMLDDNDEEPRQPHPDIVQLREAIVNHKRGSMENLSIKFHYDNMRRVGSEVRNYHYTALDPKIEGPFTLGLVLPASYGNNWIKAGDEINKSIEKNEPFDKYFQDKWKIHPNWVYCDYFHSSERKFENPEEKLLHFMEKIFSPDWEWREQYPASNFENISMDDFDRRECDRKPIDIDEFYCDKELMQLLFFDAKITHALYNSTWNPTSEFEKRYVNQYNVSVRFLATQGGLSRWQHILDLAEGELQFGDVHNRSVEEVWYKRPVLYRNLNPQAFVFSVPFNSGDNDKLKITASHAIFVEDENNEAPGSVVGYEMLHKKFYDRFMEITQTNENCPSCLPCTSDHVDCYIIDENGYVVLSEIPADTGRFFAQTELKSTGVIMETMISKKIFRRIPMFDYQALCKERIPASSASSYLLTPFYIVYASLKMFLMNLLWLLVEGNFVHVWSINEGYGDDVVPNKNPEKFKIISKPCDKKADLFMLQHEHLSAEGFDAPPPAGSTIRPFFVKRIAHSNLLLVVVKNAESSQSHLSVNPVKVEYKNTSGIITDHSCNKLNLNSFYRRKLGGCYNSHPEEPNTKVCSKCNIIKSTILFVLVMSNLCIHI